MLVRSALMLTDTSLIFKNVLANVEINDLTLNNTSTAIINIS